MRWKGRVGEKTRKVKGGAEWCRVSEIEWIGQAGGGDTIAQHMSLLPPPSTPPSFHFDDPPLVSSSVTSYVPLLSTYPVLQYAARWTAMVPPMLRSTGSLTICGARTVGESERE